MSNKRKKCTAVDLSGNNIFLFTFPIPSLMFSLLAVKCLIFHLRRRMSEWIGVDGKCEWGARVIFLTLRMALEKLFRQISELCDL